MLGVETNARLRDALARICGNYGVPARVGARSRPRSLAARLSLLLVVIASCAFASAPALALAPYKFEPALTEKLSDTLAESAPGAAFGRLDGLTFDASGNLYVADLNDEAGNPAIDKFDAANSFVAPQLGSSFLTEFSTDVAVNDETGHLYVSDSDNDNVFVMGANGEKLSEWNGANTPATNFGGGCCYLDVAVDDSTSPSRGDVYVSTSAGSGEIDVFEPQGADKEEGKYLRHLEAPGLTLAQTKTGDGMAVDDSNGPGAGDVYVLDRIHKVVDRFSPTGVFEAAHQLTGISPSQPFEEPISIAVEAATGDVFVLDTHGGLVLSAHPRVDVFGPSGESIRQISINEAGGGRLLEGEGLAVQSTGAGKGDVYVVDAQKKVIDVFALEQPAKPAIANEGVTEVTADSANFVTEISPQGATSTYQIEYGACVTPEACQASPYEHSVPVPAGSFGEAEDFSAHSFEAHVSDLSRSTTYHLRVVARNVHGETVGEERTFSTQGPGTALVLPDGRRWELVSPPNKDGADLTGTGDAAFDGGAITYTANAPTEQGVAGGETIVQVLSTRGPQGWTTSDITTPHALATGGVGHEREYQAFSADLGSTLVRPWGLFNPSLSPEASELTPYIRTLGACTSSCYRPLVTGKQGYANVPEGTHFGEEAQCEEGGTEAPGVLCGPAVEGVTPDFSHVVLKSNVPLTAGAPDGELYEWTAGKLELISVLPPNEAGEELPVPSEVNSWVAIGEGFDGENEGQLPGDVASDGRVFWQVESQDPALYLRDPVLRQTVQLDAAEPACEAKGECESGGGEFQFASPDGSTAYFLDDRPLTKDSGAADAVSAQHYDLYECKLVVEAGRLKCQLSDLTPLENGEPAQVGAHVNGKIRIVGGSEDGSTAYFVAGGKLGTGANARGETAIAGQPNLYVHRDGTTRFIATLSSQDESDWESHVARKQTRISPDGQWLTFLSQRSLTDYDNSDARSGQPDAELYVYDADSARLACASCEPTGARPVGVEYASLGSSAVPTSFPTTAFGWLPTDWVTALLPEQERLHANDAITNDGRVYFESLDALVPQDVNGTSDAYEFEPAGVGDCSPSASGYEPDAGGCVGLISSGTSPEPTGVMDATPSGGDVFFFTESPLTSDDVDSVRDIYDAHECTSASPCVPPKPVSPPPCTTEASCKPAPAPQPTIFGLPASATFSGAGNLVHALPAAPTPKTLAQIRAQRLAKALKACRAKRSKHKRTVCERQARRRYALPRPAKKSNHRSK
jgi:DNA-binding beta-propeller fold protein YncE